MAPKHSYESLAQAYFFLFVFYPVQIVLWSVRLPFQLWFNTVRIGVHLGFTFMEWWTYLLLSTVQKWILQPLGLARGSTQDMGTETIKVYDASKVRVCVCWNSPIHMILIVPTNNPLL